MKSMFLVQFIWEKTVSKAITVDAINAVLAVRLANDRLNNDEEFATLLRSHGLRMTDASAIHVEKQ
jgi:hypothetical protein